MKTVPEGFGYWVAFADNVTPSPLAQDVAETCRLLKALDAGWIAPRAGMDGWNDGALTREALAAYKRSGFGVYPWIYTRPSGVAATVAAAVALVATGDVDGIILDAEAEYIDAPGPAVKLADELRAALPDVFLAHAPLDNIAFHPRFPWREIVRGSAKSGEPARLDAVMPQLYAWEHDDSGHAAWQSKCEGQWSAWEAKNPDAAVARRWIGCCYRPATRGGRATKPRPIEEIARDVVAFRSENPEGSLYALDAAISLGQRRILHALIKAAGGVDEVDLATVLGQQIALDALGFTLGGIDGRAGQRTMEAIRAFQRSVGLTEDGVVGPTTRAALAEAFARV
jgi:hypothetical protein